MNVGAFCNLLYSTRNPRSTMETLTYDKSPEDYDPRELARRADFAADYLGDKIFNIIALGVSTYAKSCTFKTPVVTRQSDHSLQVFGDMVLDNSLEFHYTATVGVVNTADSIRIVADGSLQSVVAPLNTLGVSQAIANLLNRLC